MRKMQALMNGRPDPQQPAVVVAQPVLPSNPTALRKMLVDLGLTPASSNPQALRVQLINHYDAHPEAIPASPVAQAVRASSPARATISHFRSHAIDTGLSVNSSPHELINTVKEIRANLRRTIRSRSPIAKASYDFFENVLHRSGS